MSTRSLNKVMLIGNLTRDVDMRYTSSGTPVASFGIATNRSYVDSTGKTVETAEFTNIVAWSKLGEICGNLLKKGMKVYIEGRLQTNSWDDQNTGEKKYRTEVIATEMIIVSSTGKTDGDTQDSSVDTSAMDDGSIDFDKLSESEFKSKDKSSIESKVEEVEVKGKEETDKKKSSSTEGEKESKEGASAEETPF